MAATASQKVHSLKVFPFITHQWYACKQQAHLQSLFHQLLNDESSCLFSICWTLMEECSSSAFSPPFFSIVAQKTFILRGYESEEASEQQMSWIFLIFLYPFNIQDEVISLITWWEQGELGSHGQGEVKGQRYLCHPSLLVDHTQLISH